MVLILQKNVLNIIKLIKVFNIGVARTRKDFHHLRRDGIYCGIVMIVLFYSFLRVLWIFSISIFSQQFIIKKIDQGIIVCVEKYSNYVNNDFKTKIRNSDARQQLL